MSRQQTRHLSEASLRPINNHAYKVESAHTEHVTTQKPRRERESPLRLLWNVFKTFAILFSFLVNFVLVAVIVMLVLHADTLFAIKQDVAEPLLTDLDQAFAALGETTIDSTVHITDTIPVVFNLPLEQNTDVILTEGVPLSVPAQFILPGGGGAINGTVSLSLPEGQALPVALGMNVPVSTTVPVIMQVPVNIHLAEAGMAPAIEQLRAVFKPVSAYIQSLPDSTEELFPTHE